MTKFTPLLLPAIFAAAIVVMVAVVVKGIHAFVTHPEVKLFYEAQQEEVDNAIASIQYMVHNIRAYINQLTVEPIVYDINYFE